MHVHNQTLVEQLAVAFTLLFYITGLCSFFLLCVQTGDLFLSFIFTSCDFF